MSRGPNPLRMGRSGAGWTGIDRAAIEDRFGAAFGAAWSEIYPILLSFAVMRAEAQAQRETSFREDLNKAIDKLELAMDAIDQVMKFDRGNENLSVIYRDIEAQYIQQRMRRGDWPEIQNAEPAQKVDSIADAKGEAVRRLVEAAKRANLDPERLVQACCIHQANSQIAWKKWWERTKP